MVGAVECSPDIRHLPIEAVYQFGLVPAGDPQPRGAEQRLLDSDGS